jgi:hypothetical protein
MSDVPALTEEDFNVPLSEDRLSILRRLPDSDTERDYPEDVRFFREHNFVNPLFHDSRGRCNPSPSTRILLATIDATRASEQEKARRLVLDLFYEMGLRSCGKCLRKVQEYIDGLGLEETSDDARGPHSLKAVVAARNGAQTGGDDA